MFPDDQATRETRHETRDTVRGTRGELKLPGGGDVGSALAVWEWAGTEVDEAAHALGGAGPGLDVAARPAVAAAAPATAAGAAHWPVAARLVFLRLVLVRNACIEPPHREDES